MSLENSAFDVEKRAAEAYERWHLGTQLSALAALVIAVYPIYHYCSLDWEVLTAWIGTTDYTLFAFLVLPDIIGKAMSAKVFRSAKAVEELALILERVQPQLDPPTKIEHLSSARATPAEPSVD